MQIKNPAIAKKFHVYGVTLLVALRLRLCTHRDITADEIIAVLIVMRSVRHPNWYSYYQLPNSGLVSYFLLT